MPEETTNTEPVEAQEPTVPEDGADFSIDDLLDNPGQEETEEPEDEPQADAEEDSEDDENEEDEEPDAPKTEYSAEERAQAFDQWVEAFRNPGTYMDALRHLAGQLAQAHGVDEGQILRGLTAQKDPEPEPFGFEDEEFEYEGEQKLAAKLRELQAKIDALDRQGAEVREIAEERRQAREREALKAHARQILPGVQTAVGKEAPGFAVTDEMVATALTRFPQLRNTPAKAVQAAYHDQIVRHVAKAARGRAGKGPEGFRSTGQPGVPMPGDPAEIPADWFFDQASNRRR